MSRGKQQFLIFSFGFILALVLLSGGYVLYHKLVDAGKLRSVSLPVQVAGTLDKTRVLVAVQRIEKGDELKAEYFQPADRNTDEVPDNAVIDINMIEGRRASAVIEKKEVLTESKMISSSSLYNPDDRLKDYALEGHLVADTVKAGDWIDIEMVRTNGDTSIVLAKKQVVHLINNKAIIQVSTEERSLINHAIAEQSANMGHIEALLYIDEKQPASKVTYIPAKEMESGSQAGAEPVKSEPVKSAPALSGQVKAASAATATSKDASAGIIGSQGGRIRQ